MIIELPKPTEEELKPYNKADYIARTVEMELYKKYGWDLFEYARHLSNNYNSWYLEGKSLKITK